jgi:hypothetical protein
MLQEHRLYRWSRKRVQSFVSMNSVYSVSFDNIFILICEIYTMHTRSSRLISNGIYVEHDVKHRPQGII